MRRRSKILAVLLVIGAIALWLGLSHHGGEEDEGPPKPPPRQITQQFRDTIAKAHAARSARVSIDPAQHIDGQVTLTGRVIDIRSQEPVPNVEVVYRSAAGETSTTTESDGSYAIRVSAGLYRAFVRDDTVLSVGRPDLVRLPTLPSAETAGVPDEALMAMINATGDTDGVDLSVLRGGVVNGTVVDRNGKPVAGAVIRARGGGVRPTLATDIAESASDGTFELRLPAGGYQLDVGHPKYAGIATAVEAQLSVEPGDHVQKTITLTAGCVISGRVIGRDGKPSSDGAIEKMWGSTELEFAPAGRIEPDGTFRWVTTDETSLTLRAWPWKAPPSPGKQFACKDGAHFENVVFQIPERGADISGVLVDKAGEPVAFAFIDLAPLDPGGISQQERTDGSGHWEVYNMPAGRYRITAQAEGRGVTTQTITGPRDGVRLELGGTGRLEGTTSRLGTGSFELVLGTCLDATGMITLPQSRRLVTVAGGRFTIDDLPACELSFGAIWHGKPISEHVAIPNGGTAHVEIDIGPPREKLVRGSVHDSAGHPVEGALVTAAFQGADSVTATTNDVGGFQLKTFSGANLTAGEGGRVGFATVGNANVDAEQVDIVLQDVHDDAPPDDD